MLIEKLTMLKEILIPPIIHFIWLGGPMPDKNREWMKTWEVLHPDWTVKVWCDEDVPAFGLKNQESFDQAAISERNQTFSATKFCTVLVGCMSIATLNALNLLMFCIKRVSFIRASQHDEG